jgi:hypothetical protein
VTGVGGSLTQAAGAVVVLAVLQDVFFTVLFPASGRGLLRRPLSRWTWKAFAVVGRRLPFQRRRAWLTYSGPLQITLGLGVWILLLVTGWALIYRPALGTQIVASSGPTDTSWATAFYYSGYVLTTLGLGDVVAHDGLFRLLTVMEAGIGFATVSMAITYFLSVYSALTQRKMSAALLHHRSYDTGDAAALLAGLARDGELPGAADELMSMAGFVQRALETHTSYPVLRYFHQQRTYYALPRILLLSFDAVSLLQAVLDPDHYRALTRSPSAAALTASAHQLLAELVPKAHTRPPGPADEQAWRRRLEAAAAQFGDAGLSLRADTGTAAEDYVRLRAGWDAPLRALAAAMLYDWDDIEPPAPRDGPADRTAGGAPGGFGDRLAGLSLHPAPGASGAGNKKAVGS